MDIAWQQEALTLRMELSATIGRMMNARIDLETGETKAHAIRKLTEAIDLAKAALASTDNDHG